MGWVSPTSHLDEQNTWGAEANAHDGNTGSQATTDDTDYLQLILSSAISCNKVRIYCREEHFVYNANITISVYFGDAWHEIWTGEVADDEWVEKAIGSTELVTKAKVKFNVVIAGAKIMEFEFNEVAAPPPTYIPKVIMVT